MPSPKDRVYVLPSQVILLGEALGPVASSARQAMRRRVRSSGHEFQTINDLSRHLGVIQQALVHLSPRIDGLMTEVVHNKGAGAVEAGRAAGRLEQVLSEFVDGYLDAKSSRAGPGSSEARSLILGVYRHHIRQICDWLEELVEVIADPESALEKRGVAAAATVKLTVALDMTSPPEMASLDALAKGLLPSPEVYSVPPPILEQRESTGPGLLETMGALAFGVGITKAVLRRHRG